MTVLIAAGIYLVVLLLMLLFFSSIKKEEKVYTQDRILLKPIDFEKSEFPITLAQELKKCEEEDEEFYKEVLKGDAHNALEEFHDSVQTKLQCLDMLGLSVEVISSSQKEHFEKLKSRGWKFK